MKLLGILMASAVAAFAAGETVLIQNADVYPVNSAPIKGISLLIQDGKILDMGTRIVAPKGAMVLDVKGLRVYPGMIDSATELGLEEIESIRESVDTGEIGDFMPQLRALSAVNPDSEHFGVVRVNGITGAVTFPSLGGRGGTGGQLISGQASGDIGAVQDHVNAVGIDGEAAGRTDVKTKVAAGIHKDHVLREKVVDDRSEERRVGK